MYEINENKKVVSIMPGLDNTNSLKAYPLENTFVAGATGSGISVLIQELVVHAVTFNSPKDLQLEWYGNPEYIKGEPFLNPSRVIPHFSNQMHEYDSYDEMFTHLGKALERVYEWVINPHDIEEYNFMHKHLFIVELSNAMFRDVEPLEASHRRCILQALAKMCKYSEHFSVLYYTQYESTITDELLKYFDLRLVTRVHENKLSDMLMGCNLASKEKDQYGYVWVSHEKNPYEKLRLSVKFYPDTLVNKYTKVYSIKSQEDRNSIYENCVGISEQDRVMWSIVHEHNELGYEKEREKLSKLQYSELVRVLATYIVAKEFD